MNNKAEKKRARLIVCSVMLVFAIITLTPRFIMVWQLNARKDRLEIQQQQALEINHQLTAQKDKLGDPDTIERIAREQLGMVKKGEKVIMEVAPDGAKSP